MTSITRNRTNTERSRPTPPTWAVGMIRRMGRRTGSHDGREHPLDLDDRRVVGDPGVGDDQAQDAVGEQHQEEQIEDQPMMAYRRFTPLPVRWPRPWALGHSLTQGLTEPAVGQALALLVGDLDVGRGEQEDLVGHPLHPPDRA